MPISPAKPVAERENPYLPKGPTPLIAEKWQGVNTSALRAGVPDDQVYWSDSFFPVAPRKMATMYGVGTALYTAAVGRTVIFFAFYNINTTPYMAVFLDDGSVIQVNTDTAAQTTIMAAGTIIDPTITNVGTSQWGREYLIIVSNQTDGYWLWNGTTLFGAGGLSSMVTITNVGSAYKTTPNVIVTGGHGSGAVVAVAIDNGYVVGATVTSPGVGYLATDNVSLIFSGGNSGGTGGSLNAILSGGTGGTGASLTPTTSISHGRHFITGVSVINGGSGYSAFTVVTPVGGGPFVNAVLQANVSGGAIASVTVVNQGQYATPPTLSVSDSGLYYVSSVTVINAGAGYSDSASVVFTGGGSPVTQATAQLNLNAGGSITSVSVTSPGGYGTNTAPTVTLSDVAITATGTLSLMPFAVQGTAVETYQGRVWVAKEATIFFTAPGSFNDFATSAGGGNFTSADSFLKVAYTQLVNSNGFLWLIGDSSVNYISGIQMSDAFVTTFSNQNADPESGSPYPASVETFGRDVMFANEFGVHVLSGGLAVKISDALDGVWNSVADFGDLQLSTAKAQIFGKKVWMVLSRIVDPVSGVTANKLFCWHNKQWFPATQDITLTFIKHQEINSVITAWGTDGSVIRPLFDTPSVAIQKVAQTKLWDTPGGYLLTKAATRFWGLMLYGSTLTPDLIVSIDSELNAQPYAIPASTYTITGPSSAGYFKTPPQAVGQQGVLTGMTLKTNAADVAIVSLMMDDQVEDYRG